MSASDGGGAPDYGYIANRRIANRRHCTIPPLDVQRQSHQSSSEYRNRNLIFGERDSETSHHHHHHHNHHHHFPHHQQLSRDSCGIERMQDKAKTHQSKLPSWSSACSLNSLGASLQQSSSGTAPSSQGSRRRSQKDTMQSRFELIRTLGKGTYGKVKLGKDRRSNEHVAIKTIKKSRIENPHDLERILREIRFMSSLNHPHIIKIREVYESREKIILVMEYASGGELYEYLNRMRRIPESEARAIFRQIVSAVHFLHKSCIVHRDLKLENILIDDRGYIKLADFGLSNNWTPNHLLQTFCGSPLYASPEIVKGIPYFGPEVDCWSLGVLLYTLVYGSMPFQGGDYNRLVHNISNGDFIPPKEKSGAYMLIKKCLCVDPARRASIDTIAEHWWVNFGFKYPPIVYHNYVPRATGIQGLSCTSTAPTQTAHRMNNCISRANVVSTTNRVLPPKPTLMPTTENYRQ